MPVLITFNGTVLTNSPKVIRVGFEIERFSLECQSNLRLLRFIEQFSVECRKTKTKIITLANNKGSRAIHCPIKTRSNYTKRGKTCGFGFSLTSD